ncbi:hypothetical protein [Fretibacterium sp. OH1220_COT-178]|uniref:hypothetical protein n=1 Tax=Fretibacterium sp. OH1220_COT-178 TaxID=2491047 RepID=UPI001F482B8E|nr:hypothetical protein [Fretibacterium sp. OH1220_COT-178]
MNKKLKLFGLLALTLALGAGVAWAALPDHVLPGNWMDDIKTAVAGANAYNTISGNGTQLGSVKTDDAASPNFLQILQLNADAGNTVTLAPRATGNKVFQESVAARAVQVLVNNGNSGKVVIRASNGDDPKVVGGNDYFTRYHGGTVQMGGTLGVTNNNALGQRWVGVVGSRTEARAPVFQVEEVDKLQLGVNDPKNRPTFQPFFLMRNTADGGAAADLRYVKVNADAVSSKLQGLTLHHGLSQRNFGAPASGAGTANDTFVTAADAAAGEFVRLIKQGKGSLFINGDTTSLAAAAEGMVALPDEWALAGIRGYKAVDGAHHQGGTVVEAGILQVDAGNASVPNDHFRGSLGKVWAAFQGSLSATATPYDPASYLARVIESAPAAADGAAGGAIYNPLFILNDAKVMVNRSQFFSDFNVAKDATFHVDEYTLAGTNYNPQIAVTLDDNDSKADGLLEGKFDLVLNSISAVNFPTNAPRSAAINVDAQAIFFINNPDNKIFASGDTLVANGVLEIMGAKSIGGGQVTIGATGGNGLPDRGFSTPVAPAAGLGTFAAAKTFKLENVTVGQPGGAVAVERGETLSFKDITLNNMGTADVDSFRINPVGVALGEGYLNNAGGDPFPATLVLTNPLPGSWTDSATVAFGAMGSDDAKYSVEGVLRNPTRVDVERGVWQLNGFPVPTTAQVAAGEKPFMNVYVYPTAALSLAKDVNDFSNLMDLKVTDDSRIRVVLRDSDIAATRSEAMAKEPVFQAHHVDYSALGAGAQNKDRRLVIQLDPTQLTGSMIKKGWVKLVFSPDAKNWNNLHYLREYTPGLTYEDYAKVRITWTTTSDIVKNAVAHVDENSYTILVEVGEDVNDPVNPGTPPAVEKDLKAVITAPAEVKVGSMVTFELGKWTYTKASGDVEVQDVKWMLDGVDKTADVKDSKLTVKAEKEGTMNLVVTAKLKADRWVCGPGPAPCGSSVPAQEGLVSETNEPEGGCPSALK